MSLVKTFLSLRYISIISNLLLIGAVLLFVLGVMKIADSL
jgi:hypothetical protein